MAITAGRVIAVTIVAALHILGCWGIYYGMMANTHSKKLTDTGIRTEAKVSNCDSRTYNHVNEEGKVEVLTDYTFTVSYQDKTGKEYQRKVEGENCNGQTHQDIYYNPENPNEIDFPFDAESYVTVYLLMATVAFMGVYFVMMTIKLTEF